MRSSVSEYDLVVARDLPAALDLLHANEGWRPFAGGTDLMVLLNAGRLVHRRLVGVNGIPELRHVEAADGFVLIGAAVTYSDIQNNPILQSEFPLLCQAASWTGGRANQNRGTLGGNIANASPAADSAPMLLVYDAELQLASRAGTRWLRYADFHLGYKQMDLRSDELITQIRLRRPANGLRQYARKVGTRKAQAISKVCFASAAERTGNVLSTIRIAVGSVAPIPLRCYETEKALQERELSPAVVANAKQVLAREISPITDIRSTGQYRAQVTVNLLGEFLENLL